MRSIAQYPARKGNSAEITDWVSTYGLWRLRQARNVDNQLGLKRRRKTQIFGMLAQIGEKPLIIFAEKKPGLPLN